MSGREPRLLPGEKEWLGWARVAARPFSPTHTLSADSPSPQPYLFQHVQANSHDRHAGNTIKVAHGQPTGRAHEPRLARDAAQCIAQRARDRRLAHGLDLAIPEGQAHQDVSCLDADNGGRGGVWVAILERER